MSVPTSPIPPVDVQAVHTSGHQSRVDLIVTHVTAQAKGGYPDSSQPDVAGGTARYFTDPNSGGSAHTVSDTSRLLRCVAENMVAWHAPPNDNSLGNEIAGQAWYTREQWLSSDVRMAWERCAHEEAAQARRWDVPVRKLTVDEVRAGKRGFCGHVDKSQAFGQSDHTDPGPNFPWDIFMDRALFYFRNPDTAPFNPGTTPPDVLEGLDMTEQELTDLIYKTTRKVLVDLKINTNAKTAAAQTATCADVDARTKRIEMLATAINNTVNAPLAKK